MIWPPVLFFICVLVLAASMLLLSFVLGQRHRGRTTAEPYESGIAPTGLVRPRFHVSFYLVAMMFVVFDIEAVFIFSWAVALREAGITGYVSMFIFILVLLIALVYLHRSGAFELTGPRSRRDSTQKSVAKAGLERI